MDDELKQFLTENEKRLEGKVESLSRLITDVKESLEREIRIRFDGIDARLDAIDTRLDRQGGWLRGGQTNLVRLNDWSENVDKLLSDLAKRLAKLEGEGRSNH